MAMVHLQALTVVWGQPGIVLPVAYAYRLRTSRMTAFSIAGSRRRGIRIFAKHLHQPAQRLTAQWQRSRGDEV